VIVTRHRRPRMRLSPAAPVTPPATVVGRPGVPEARRCRARPDFAYPPGASTQAAYPADASPDGTSPPPLT
jgi:hypothetical protein